MRLRAAVHGASVLLLALLLCPEPAPAAPFGAAPNPIVSLDSHEAGASPAHRLTFDVQTGELEVYRAAVTYPDAFRLNGFDVLGPANTEVGALLVDFNFDGVPDTTIPLRSLSPSSAYGDVIADGRFTAGVEPMLGRSRASELTLLLPYGGDANRDTVVVPRAVRIAVVLFPGVLTNPDAGGSYTIRAELVSVDPDTDGPDDGLGAPPARVGFSIDVPIAPPADVIGPLFLHAGAGPASASALFLDGVAPTSAPAKFRDSPALSVRGGNPWREIGAWRAVDGAAEGALSAPVPLRVWVGLRNSDDQGTGFDLRADLERNGTTVATGITRCIARVTRNPALATPVTISVAPLSTVVFSATEDELRLRIFARIGTNGDGTACVVPGGAHASATGLRLYFDAVERASVLGALP